MDTQPLSPLDPVTPANDTDAQELDDLSPLTVLAHSRQQDGAAEQSASALPPTSAANTQLNMPKEQFIAVATQPASGGMSVVQPPIAQGMSVQAPLPATPDPLLVDESSTSVPLRRPPATPPAPVPQVALPQQAVAARFERVLDGGARQRRARGIALATGLVLLLGIGLYAAVAFAGVRVPLLYTAVTGLPDNGTALAAAVQGHVQASTRYTATTTTTIRRTTETAAGESDVAGAVNSLAVVGGMVEFKPGKPQRIGSLPVVVNQDPTNANVTSQVVAFNTNPGIDGYEDTDWIVYVPNFQEEDGGESTPMAVSGTDLQATLLQTVVAPLSLQELLNATGAERQYAMQRSQQGTSLAYNQFNLSNTALNSVLPRGATSTDQVFHLWTSWNSGATPIQYRVTATVTYLGVQYVYQQDTSLKDWGVPMETTEATGLKQITSGLTADDVVDAGDIELFTQQLGILSLESLPNTLDEIDMGDDDTGTNVSPTPSPSVTPSPSPSPTNAAGVPAGNSVSSVQPLLPANPPVPGFVLSATVQAQDAARFADLTLLAAALRQYAAETGRYPVSESSIQIQASQMMFTALLPKHLTAMPVDPLATQYWYEYASNAAGTTARLRSVAFDRNAAGVVQGTVYSYYEIVLPSVVK